MQQLLHADAITQVYANVFLKIEPYRIRKNDPRWTYKSRLGKLLGTVDITITIRNLNIMINCLVKKDNSILA